MVVCGECGSLMNLRNSRFGKFYGCSAYPKCKGTHGAHPDGRPLGIPANKETKEARIRAHAAFDLLWKNGAMHRKSAYAWLRNAMNLEPDACHIGSFDKDQCAKVESLVQAFLSVPKETSRES
jgi:ssDNA-binding Zn-finger/Zn-ribbon topoisomerase 1